MKTQHLFYKEECIAIEDKYGRHIVYRAFRSPCLNIANESGTFSLHPSDLFYQCLYTIDELKGMSFNENEGYCLYQLRDDLYAHFQAKVENVDTKDLQLAVFIVMQAVAEWLVRCGSQYLVLVGILKEQIDEKVSTKLNILFRHGFKCVNEEEISNFMNRYMDSSECISDEIHTLLDAMDDELDSGIEHTLRIADGKKRSVVVALKAIIESDWVEDVNGGRPKNIEKAVNEILRLAFGERKNTALPQTIKPSSDIDFEGSMNRIAEELADKIKGFASEKGKKR